MWYLIAGKLMCLIIYFIFSKAFVYTNELSILERLIGWFFVEHLFEEYNILAGKFFLTNVDFRTLLKNLLIIFRNVFVWSHFVTLTEFLLTVSILILITYFLVYFLKLKKINANVMDIFILSYYAIIIYLLLLKTFFSFDLFDIFFIFKPITALLFLCSCLFIAIRFLLFYFIVFTLNTIVRYCSVVFIKTIFYVLIIFCLNILFFTFFSITLELSNNLVQELLVKILVVYTYAYYSFKLI
jgi:hypothetical protein